MSISKIPSKIKVKIEKHGNSWSAYLPEYKAFTEFDSISDAPYYVNDLLYAIFEIPKEIQKHIYFAPIQRKPLKIQNPLIDPKIVLFNKLFTEEYLHASS